MRNDFFLSAFQVRNFHLAALSGDYDTCQVLLQEGQVDVDARGMVSLVHYVHIIYVQYHVQESFNTMYVLKVVRNCHLYWGQAKNAFFVEL